MKLFRGVLGVTAAAVLLCACSASGGDSNGSSGLVAPSAPASDTTATLKVWLMDGSQPQSVIDTVNDEFKKQYPNVEVQVELQQWGGIQDKLSTSLGTDSTPDVVEIGNSVTAKYAAAGLLADLSGAAGDLGVAGMLPGLKVAGELDGIRYGIPYYGGVRIVVYRKSDFKDAKITAVPKTYDELAATAAKLRAANKKNRKYSAFYFPGRYWNGAVPFVWMNGGDIATRDGETWTGTLDSAQSQRGLEQLNTLVQKYSKAPKDGDETGNVDAFKTGNVGMMIDSWWAPGVLDTGDRKGDIGVFALPGLTAKRTAPVFIGGSDLAVSAKSAQQGLATEWISILTGTPVQTQLAKEAGVTPNQQAAFVGHEGNDFLQVADDAARNSMFTPVTPYWGNVESSAVLPDMLVQILTGKATIADATKQASTEVTKLLSGG